MSSFGVSFSVLFILFHILVLIGPSTANVTVAAKYWERTNGKRLCQPELGQLTTWQDDIWYTTAAAIQIL